MKEGRGEGLPKKEQEKQDRNREPEKRETVEKIEERDLQEDGRDDEMKMQEARLMLEKVQNRPFPMKTREQKIAEYLDHYLPNIYKKPRTLTKIFGVVSNIFVKVHELFKGPTLEGKEHVPQNGALLVVANHTRNSDPEVIRALIGRDMSIVAADMHFSNFLKSFFMKRIGGIEVEGTLSHYSEEERKEILARTPWDARSYYKKVLERDERRKNDPEERKRSTEKQTEALKIIVAKLAKGEVVTLFPEGLWTYKGHQLRKAQEGARIIALEYKRLTGGDLPVLPVAISDKLVKAGEMTSFADKRTIHDVMKQIALMLPKDARGFYGEE